MAVSRKYLVWVLECVLAGEESFRSATHFMQSKDKKITVIRATRRHKPSKRRNENTEVVLTIGKPNYAEREVLRRRKKKGWALTGPLMLEYPKKKK